MSMEWILKYFPDYGILTEYEDIDKKNGEFQEIHGLQEADKATFCMFCGKPRHLWKKKDIAHAVSECLGNKRIINYFECYDCNHLFGEIAENHLGKFIMPYRLLNEVYGKGKSNNVIKDFSSNEELTYGTYRFEQRKNTPVFQSEMFEVYNMLIEKEGAGRLVQESDGISISIPRQKYNPKMVYASLLKIAYTLLPFAEITNYHERLVELYLNMSMNPFYDNNGEIMINAVSESDRIAYLDRLPNVGIEIITEGDDVSNGVNVCMMNRLKDSKILPMYLFAIQMKRYTIVIPVNSNELNCSNIRINVNDNSKIRKILFTEVENEFVCKMCVNKYEIPKEYYREIELALREKNLLKEKEE